MAIFASPGTNRAKTELRNISQTDFDNFFEHDLEKLKEKTNVSGILNVVENQNSYTYKFAEKLLEDKGKQTDFFKAIKFQADSLGTKRNGLFNTLIYNTTRNININDPQAREELHKKIMAFLKAQKDTDIRRDDTDVDDEDTGARGAHRIKNKSVFAKLISKRLSDILKVFMVLVLYVFIDLLDKQAKKEEAERKRKLAEEKKRKERAEAEARQKEEEERARAEEEKRKERAEAKARQKEEEERARAEEKKRKEQAEADAKQKEEGEERARAGEKKRKERAEADARQKEAEAKRKKLEEERKRKEKAEADARQKEEEAQKSYQAWLKKHYEDIDAAFKLPDEVTDESIKTFLSRIEDLKFKIEIRVLYDRGKEVYVDDNNSLLKAHFSEKDADELKEKLHTTAKERILALLKSYMEKIEIEKTVEELHALTHALDITKINSNDVTTKKKDLDDKVRKVERLFKFAVERIWELPNEMEEALQSAKNELEDADTFWQRQKEQVEERKRKAEEERRRKAEEELDRKIAEEEAARKAAQPRKREELRKMKEEWWKSYKSKNPDEDTAEEDEPEIDKDLKEDLIEIYGSEEKIPPNIFQQKVDTVLNNPGIIAMRGGSPGLATSIVGEKKTVATYSDFAFYLSGQSEYADKAKIFADKYRWGLTNEPRFNKRMQEDRHTVLITRDTGVLSTSDDFIDLIYLDAVYNDRLYKWYPYFFEGATKTKLKIGETEYERVPYYVLPKGIDTSKYIPEKEVIKGQLKPIYMQSDVEGKKNKYVKMNITDVYDFCGKYKKMLKSKECDRIIITYQCDESKIKVSIKTNLDDVEPIVLDDTKFKKLMKKHTDRVIYRGVSKTGELGDLRVFMKLKKEGTDHNVYEHNNQWFGPGVYWAKKLKSDEGGALRYGSLVVMGLYRGEPPIPSNLLVNNEYKDIFVQSTNDQIIMRSKAMYYVGDNKKLEEKVQKFNKKYGADIVCCRTDADIEKWANCE